MLEKINYLFRKKQKRELISLIVLITFGALFELASISAILPLFDQFSDTSDNIITPYVRIVSEWLSIDSEKELFLLMSGILIVIFFLKNAYLMLMHYTIFRYSYNLQRELSVRLMGKYMYRDYLFHTRENVASLHRNVTEDMGQFVTALIAALNLCSELLISILLVIFLLSVDFSSSIFMGAFFLLFFGVFYWIYRKVQVRIGIKYRRALADRNLWIIQSFGGIKEIKAMSQERFFVDRYESAYKKFAVYRRRSQFLETIPKCAMEFICVIGFLCAMDIRLISGATPKEIFPALMVFMIAAARLLPSFNRITSYVSSLLFNKAAIDNVYRDLKEMESIKETDTNDLADSITLRSALEVSGVSFKYPGTETEVLHQVNLTIPYRKSVAIVGSSGAGKTTLIDIMLGLLPPTEGKILVDHVDISFHTEAWHRVVGYIPQSIYLIDDSIKANIAFGDVEKNIDYQRLETAIKEAQLYEFVKSLPDGVNTVVGERGVRLSGGQRQRIGIARALYRNPEILIMDEATSSLDNTTEKAVMESINRLQGSHTMVIIAHRLSTIENCDIRYEIKDGKVIEVGYKDTN